MNIFQKNAIVPPEYDGSRLDKALELFVPGQGLRQRRRLFLSHVIRVDEKIRSKGTLVRAGQRISLEPLSSPVVSLSETAPPVVVARTGQFAALHKPGAMHSQTLASNDAPAADQYLSELFSDARAELLNRLDYLTSGLLLVGISPAAKRIYTRRQESGEVSKWYFAVVQGRLESAFVAQNALDTAKRRKVKVLDAVAPVLRQSLVEPLAWDHGPDGWRTLVQVRIRKGARHQIRAHLSFSGHPIVGDPLYGSGPEGGVLFLHHVRIRFPEFTAMSLPCWPGLPDAFLKAVDAVRE